MKLSDNEIRDNTKLLEVEFEKGVRKIAIKVVDIFDNDTMKIIGVMM